jgi:hypothetical protein
MNETNASTRADTPDAGAWLSVTEAAARAGVSEKTLRKRIASGAVAAEKVALDNGGWKWRVLAERLEAVGTVGSATETVETSIRSQKDAQRLEVPTAANRVREVSGADVPTVPTDELPTASNRSHGDGISARVLAAENEILREALQRERENADQWRAQVEAANRQAAESAAALREYLKISAKALPSAEYVQGETGAQDGQQQPKSGGAGIVSGAAKNAAQSGVKREMRPLWKVVLGIR